MGSMIENLLAGQRRARGWTQGRAAEAAGISRQSYAAIEAGRAVPSTEVALRLAQVFGRAVEELFRLRGDVGGRVRASQAGGALRLGDRVRLATIGGREIAYGAGERQRAPGWAAGEVAGVEAEEVEVALFPGRPPSPALVVAGCDPAFGLVAEALRRWRGHEVLWVEAGSRAALEMLARGEVHVAGAHLRDPASGEFNGPWVSRLVPFGCTRITFAHWEQGLLVRAGNPLGIGGVGDLARAGVRFLNREAGSGSRALLDERLVRAGIAPGQIAGYGVSGGGHFAVAEAIAAGLADAGVGIRAAGSAFGLEVIPLEVERYELVIPDHFLELPAVEALLESLRRPDVRVQVESLRGYDVAGMGAVA